MGPKQSSVPTFIQVKGWKDMQHYKHRSPPWIKLHAHMLDDPAFSKLTSCDVGVYAKLLLIASKLENCIPYDTRWLRTRYGISVHSIAVCAQAGLITICDGCSTDDDRDKNQSVELKDASTALADCVRPASSEERENRKRVEKKAEQELGHDREHVHEHKRDLERELQPKPVDASRKANGTSVAGALPRTALRNLSRDLPRMPELRKGMRQPTDFEAINDAVEKLIKTGGLDPEDYAALARVACITQAQAATAVQQLRDRDRI